jgi:phosphatidylglycerol:prolipoprotein diacylglycerol transferase
MIQELFKIPYFGVPISPFGVLLVAAFLASYLQLRWGLIYQRVGDDEDASALVFAAGVGGILGSKIYYAILYGDWHLLFDRSGLVWYGGFILGAAAVIWTLRRRHLPPWQVCDAAMPGLALGYGVGRIGCFLVGDDYGRPTDGPLGVIFPHGLPETTAGNLREIFHYAVPASVPDSQLVPVHPTQLYETVLGILIWIVGVSVLRRGFRPGTTSVVVLALLALERFGIEFLRAKDDRFLGGLTVAQGLSLAILVVLALLWMRRPAAVSGPGAPARRAA